MSRTLKWRPSNTGNALPSEIMYKLRELRGDSGEWIMDNTDLPVLKALALCNVAGAKELIAAIEKYRDVTVFEE